MLLAVQYSQRLLTLAELTKNFHLVLIEIFHLSFLHLTRVFVCLSDRRWEKKATPHSNTPILCAVVSSAIRLFYSPASLFVWIPFDLMTLHKVRELTGT